MDSDDDNDEDSDGHCGCNSVNFLILHGSRSGQCSVDVYDDDDSSDDGDEMSPVELQILRLVT